MKNLVERKRQVPKAGLISEETKTPEENVFSVDDWVTRKSRIHHIHLSRHLIPHNHSHTTCEHNIHIHTRRLNL